MNSVSIFTSGALKVISVAFLLSIVIDSSFACSVVAIFKSVPVIVIMSPGSTSPDKVVEGVGITGAI